MTHISFMTHLKQVLQIYSIPTLSSIIIQQRSSLILLASFGLCFPELSLDSKNVTPA